MLLNECDLSIEYAIQRIYIMFIYRYTIEEYICHAFFTKINCVEILRKWVDYHVSLFVTNVHYSGMLQIQFRILSLSKVHLAYAYHTQGILIYGVVCFLRRVLFLMIGSVVVCCDVSVDTLAGSISISM